MAANPHAWLAEIEARAAKASPEPWKACNANEHGVCRCGLIWSVPADGIVAQGRGCSNDAMGEGFTDEQRQKNQDFIAHAREDVPRLCAVLRAAEKLVDQLLEDDECDDGFRLSEWDDPTGREHHNCHQFDLMRMAQAVRSLLSPSGERKGET